MSSNQHFDVVISGGGLSGCLMALSLIHIQEDQLKQNQRPLSIAMIEVNPLFNDASATFDDRVLALSHHSASYLKRLGLWPQLERYAQAIKTIHVSDKGYYGKARIHSDEHDVEALGYVIEMNKLGQALLLSIKNHQQITWFTETKISDIQWHADHVSLDLSTVAPQTPVPNANQTSQLTAKLLLGCDGAHSICREFAGIATENYDYQHTAIIANVLMNNAHENVAYERFTEHGPIAMLPLVDDGGMDKEAKKCSLVWSLTPELAQQMLTLDDVAFSQALESAFGLWLGRVKHVGKRSAFKLALTTANEQVYHRMALIGNASHTIHPIAGQGFNLGLRDVAQLSLSIKQALSHQQDIGELALLLAYAQQRQQDHQQVIAMTDSLVRLFSTHSLPLVVGRNIGLKIFNYLKPLKKRLVHKTMGY